MVIGGDPSGLPDHLSDVSGNDQTLPVEMFTGRSEGKGPVVAVQQFYAQFLFQLFDLLGDRRLGNVTLLSRLIEITIFNDRL